MFIAIVRILQILKKLIFIFFGKIVVYKLLFSEPNRV